jgi:hypothetical protein
MLPSCDWYFAKYGPAYWGGAPFNDLQMMRDADDVGEPSPSDPNKRINFKKEGLFDATQPLFPDMIAREITKNGRYTIARFLTIPSTSIKITCLSQG